MQTKIGLALMLAAMALGCAHRSEEHRAPAREYRADYGRDWNKLGERWVDGAHGRRDPSRGAPGPYRRIMIVVEHSALEMDDVVVRFADGSAYSPQTRHVFAANARWRHVIDLPGTRREIRSVEFRYGQLPGGGRAQAELWAQ